MVQLIFVWLALTLLPFCDLCKNGSGGINVQMVFDLLQVCY